MRLGLSIALLLLAASPLFAQTESQPQQKPDPQQSSGPAASKPADAQPAAKIDPKKEAAIRHLQEVTGSKAMFNQLIGTFAQVLQKNLANDNPGDDRAKLFSDLFFEKLQSGMAGAYDMLQAAMIPIYDKFYSTEDIEGLIKFYESPLGQKTLKAMPQIMTELSPIAFEWGQELGRRIANEIVQEHPELREVARKAFPAKT